MRKLIFILITAGLATTSSANSSKMCAFPYHNFAAECINSLRTASGKIVVARPNIIYSDSSEYDREDKNFLFAGGFGIIAKFVSFATFIKPDLLAQFSYTQQSDTIVGQSISLGAGFSNFWTNSLYSKVEAAYRSGDTIDYKKSIFLDRGTFHSVDYGIDLGIGNRWSWNNIVLGGEWFAVYFPLIGKDVKTFEMQFRVCLIHMGYMW